MEPVGARSLDLGLEADSKESRSSPNGRGGLSQAAGSNSLGFAESSDLMRPRRLSFSGAIEQDVGILENSDEDGVAVKINGGNHKGKDEEKKPLLTTHTRQVLSDPSVINLEDTFWHMKQRQWGRLYRSTFAKPRPFSYLYLFLYFILYFVYLGLQIGKFHVGANTNYILEYVLMAFFTIGAGYLSPLFGWFVRVLILLIYSFFYTFFLMNMYAMPRLYVPLACGLGGLSLLTLINYVFYTVALRAYYSCTGTLSPKIEVNEGELGVRYEIEQIHVLTGSSRSVYEGDMVNGRPHGFGTWIDTSYQGELLRGYWRNGIPIGPFESTENDTRNMLVNLRIIYATDGGGRWWLNRIPLSIGVGAVETCVSGNFFQGYPLVTMLAGPRIAKNYDAVKEVFDNKYYTHLDDDKLVTSVTVAVDKKYHRLQVAGFQSTVPKSTSVQITLNHTNGNAKTQNDGNTYSLSMDAGWRPSGGSEGILFIHGFHHTLDDALKRFGQFLALGHFPPYLKPFCFSWPGSISPALYWCASSSASDNDVHRDLRRFVRMLSRAGITTLHVMCHSMGSRLFLRAFPILKELLKRRSIQVDANASFQDYKNMELLNPALDYQHGRSPSVSESILSPPPPQRDLISLQNIILLNPDYESETFFNDYWDLAQYAHHVTIYADSRDRPLRAASTATQSTNLSDELFAKKKAQKYLEKIGGEIDMIDTVDLDRNMDSQFHGYFNINRVMVDDLHELIVTGKRADERTSRLKQHAGTYRFTIVPSSVVTI